MFLNLPRLFGSFPLLSVEVRLEFLLYTKWLRRALFRRPRRSDRVSVSQLDVVSILCLFRSSGVRPSGPVIRPAAKDLKLSDSA
jgi:hypothetical protein